jgi:ankyrin repeat protein
MIVCFFLFLQNSFTPLHFAAWHKHYEVAKLLIEKGADVKCCGKVSGTSYKLIIVCGRSELFSWDDINEL